MPVLADELGLAKRTSPERASSFRAEEKNRVGLARKFH
jgi:hypothetical protein